MGHKFISNIYNNTRKYPLRGYYLVPPEGRGDRLRWRAEPETLRRDDSIIGHLVTSPSFARQSPLANDGDDTRWRQIESSVLKVCESAGL